ncbi:MAG TPA: F0F1 ATP synthase subunit alpha [bacterium]
MADVSETATDTRVRFDVREIGHVRSVREFILRVKGLPSCMNGQMVEFPRGGRGMVMGYTEQDVFVLVFGEKAGVRAGDEVHSRGEPFTIPTGEAFLGRVVSSLGEPVDGAGPVDATGTRPIFGEAPGVMERQPVREALETGVRTIDAGFPIAKGQRQLIIGDQMTGKTTIITDTILNQQGKDVVCIYCAVGQSQSSFMKTVRLLRERGAMAYTVAVAGIASAPLGEQYLAPYAAAALAESFAAQGRDVFVGFDDLGKHAWAYRQLSLLLERSPGREAYPGDIFYIHSQLLERAGRFIEEFGGGTITFFPVVPTIQGDITGYIQTNLISITDGQIYLSTPLFQQGFKPAIDFGLSVSRIGNRAQPMALKDVSAKLRLEYLQYQELLRMTAMKAELSAEASAKVQRGQVITELLTQPKAAPSPMEEQIVLLFAIRQGLLDGLPRFRRRFKGEVYAWLKTAHPEILRDLRQKQVLTPGLKRELGAALEEYVQQAGGGA